MFVPFQSKLVCSAIDRGIYVQLAPEIAEESALERADPVTVSLEPEPWSRVDVVSDLILNHWSSEGVVDSLAQKFSPNAMAVAASAGLQTALEQSRTP